MYSHVSVRTRAALFCPLRRRACLLRHSARVYLLFLLISRVPLTREHVIAYAEARRRRPSLMPYRPVSPHPVFREIRCAPPCSHASDGDAVTCDHRRCATTVVANSPRRETSTSRPSRFKAQLHPRIAERSFELIIHTPLMIAAPVYTYS